MKDAVEIVARELAAAYGSDPRYSRSGFGPDQQWPEYASIASDILRALSDAGLVVVPREPTDRMVRAVWNNDGSFWSKWRAMLDAAGRDEGAEGHE